MALYHPRLSISALKPLAQQPQAVLRAIASAALAAHYLADQDQSPDLLKPLGQDSRKDVRRALLLGPRRRRADHLPVLETSGEGFPPE